MTVNRSPALLDWMALVFLTLVWGSSFILIKKGLVSFNSLEVASLRISISFLVLLPFALRHLKKVKRDKLLYFALAGILGSAIPSFLFAKAQTIIDSYLAGVLNSLTPLFTLLAGLLLFGARSNGIQGLGVVIGCAGAVGLLSMVHDPGLGNGLWYGLLVVLATICYALNMNIIKKHLSSYGAITITSVMFVFVGFPAMAVLFTTTGFVETLAHDTQSLVSLGYIALLAALGTALSLVVHNWLITRTSALFASSVTYMMPMVSILWGIFDGESFFLVYLIWIALILVGVYLTTHRTKSIPRRKGMER